MGRVKLEVTSNLVAPHGDLRRLTSRVKLIGGAIVLDPNGSTFIAQLHPGQKLDGRVDGQWCPGIGWPYYGPGGDPGTNYGNYHRFSCLIASLEANGTVRGVIENDPKDGFEVINASTVDIFVHAGMCDDLYGDNINNPADPMRVTKQFEG